MPDYFQIIVARDVARASAEHVGQKALEWMADELVIEDTPSRSVPPKSRPDNGRRGFRPAELWQSAIVEIDESFLDIEFNGVELVTGRQIFDAGDYEPTPYCPQCHAPDSPKFAHWKGALDAWARGEDRAALRCPACGATSPVVDWRHDPPIGFGNLGWVFWNWPSLNREFISRMEALLGDRLVLVEGKRT